MAVAVAVAFPGADMAVLVVGMVVSLKLFGSQVELSDRFVPTPLGPTRTVEGC